MIFSPSLTHACSEKKKNNNNKEELQLLQLGVEPETLLLVQMMCFEDTVHVTRTLFMCTLDLERALIMCASCSIVT